ncbi:MAG: glycosyltransferase 61 family protein [Alphaproteobacteria bacterium]
MKPLKDPTRYLIATKDKFLKCFNAKPDINESLKISVIPNATISLHNANIKLCSQKVRHVKNSKKINKNTPYVDEDIILLGYGEDFIGHFLANSFSRAWPILDKKYKNHTFVIVTNGPLAPNGKEFYKLMGIKKLLFVNTPVRFKNVLVPDSSFNYTKLYANKKFSETFKKIADAVKPDPKSPKKIYLSRTKFTNNMVLGEDQIEKIFKKAGFKIIHPQIPTKTGWDVMPLQKQIQLMKGADVIAGVEGTGLHLSLFAKDGIDLICLHRYNNPLVMQIMIDKLKNINSYYIDTSIDPYSKKKNTCPACIIGINKNLQRFFKDYGFIYNTDSKADKKEMDKFLKIYKEKKRVIPKWLGNIILTFISSRNMRHSLRHKLGLK